MVGQMALNGYLGDAKILRRVFKCLRKKLVTQISPERRDRAQELCSEGTLHLLSSRRRIRNWKPSVTSLSAQMIGDEPGSFEPTGWPPPFAKHQPQFLDLVRSDGAAPWGRHAKGLKVPASVRSGSPEALPGFHRSKDEHLTRANRE